MTVLIFAQAVINTYRYLTYQNKSVSALVAHLSPIRRRLAFVAGFVLFSLATISITPLWFSSWPLDFGFLLVISTWSGVDLGVEAVGRGDERRPPGAF